MRSGTGDGVYHTVTPAWIYAHRTPAGSWTRAQVEALGLTWPPLQGWQRRLTDTRIPDAARLAFEAGRDKVSDRTRLKNAKRAARVAALPGRQVDFVARHERQLGAVRDVLSQTAEVAESRPLDHHDVSALLFHLIRALGP
jgi:hypothetical protein